jgi:hypothetical protein
MLFSNNHKSPWWQRLIVSAQKFLVDQRDNYLARAASPTLTGLNIIDEDYTPVKLSRHPGAGSHEEIEPMK